MLFLDGLMQIDRHHNTRRHGTGSTITATVTGRITAHGAGRRWRRRTRNILVRYDARFHWSRLQEGNKREFGSSVENSKISITKNFED